MDLGGTGKAGDAPDLASSWEVCEDKATDRFERIGGTRAAPRTVTDIELDSPGVAKGIPSVGGGRDS